MIQTINKTRDKFQSSICLNSKIFLNSYPIQIIDILDFNFQLFNRNKFVLFQFYARLERLIGRIRGSMVIIFTKILSKYHQNKILNIKNKS